MCCVSHLRKRASRLLCVWHHGPPGLEAAFAFFFVISDEVAHRSVTNCLCRHRICIAIIPALYRKHTARGRRDQFCPFVLPFLLLALTSSSGKLSFPSVCVHRYCFVCESDKPVSEVPLRDCRLLLMLSLCLNTT